MGENDLICHIKLLTLKVKMSKMREMFKHAITLQNCVGVTAAPRHPQELTITDSDSPGAAPTNPLFSAFDLGGGKP